MARREQATGFYIAPTEWKGCATVLVLEQAMASQPV